MTPATDTLLDGAPDAQFLFLLALLERELLAAPALLVPSTLQLPPLAPVRARAVRRPPLAW